MSDTEVIITLLRTVEWRIRINRLLQELALGLSAVLVFLIGIKVWDLFSPLQAAVVSSLIIGGGLLFVAYGVHRFLNKGTLDQAAVSIDHTAGLHDEIKTAFWFINNPRSSDWVEQQIQRAAKKAGSIDLVRVYPSIVPRNSYIVAVMIFVFIGLNFVPLPLNHNWLMLQAALASKPLDNRQAAALHSDPDSNLGPKQIRKRLQELARHLQDSELLKDVADDLLDGDAKRAAEDLRTLAQQLGKASSEETEKFRQSLEAAAADQQAGLENVLEDFAEAAEAVEENDDAVAEEEIEQAAQALEQLNNKMQGPSPGSEFQSEKSAEDSSADATQVPDVGQAPKRRSNTNGPGATKPPAGGLAEYTPKTLEAKLQLDVKLQQEALKGLDDKTPPRSEDDEEVSQASRQERSKLDYRNVRSELTPAQKDLLNQDHIPWEYRPLIKSYFQALRPSVKN